VTEGHFGKSADIFPNQIHIYNWEAVTLLSWGRYR